MKELMIKANELLKVQGNNGNWNFDKNMYGFYNGMEIILSVLEKRKPAFRTAPDVFISEKNTHIEVYKAVTDINGVIDDFAGSESQHLYMETDGCTTLVKFLGCTIFNSDDDDRDTDDETGEYKLTIEQCLIEGARDCISMASNIGDNLK